jgi:hypothetical protein
VAAVNEPTPEEAAAALRTVHEGKEQVIKSALGSRWMWIVSGLIVFLYCAAIDLFPGAGTWLGWPFVACCLLLALGLRTRVGSALLGQPVRVSSRSVPLTITSRLLRIVPLLVIGVVAVVLVPLLHVPHGGIYYGALAGLYIMFLGPRFQLWLLRRQDRD